MGRPSQKHRHHAHSSWQVTSQSPAGKRTSMIATVQKPLVGMAIGVGCRCGLPAELRGDDTPKQGLIHTAWDVALIDVASLDSTNSHSIYASSVVISPVFAQLPPLVVAGQHVLKVASNHVVAYAFLNR